MKLIRLRIGEVVLIGLLLCSLAISVYYYPRLCLFEHPSPAPEDTSGLKPYSGFLPTFGIPLLMLGVLILYSTIPRLRAQPPDVRFRYYDRLMIWAFAFWLLGQLAELSNVFAKLTCEHGFIATKVFGMTAIGALFYLLGDTFAHAKPGWFVALPCRGSMRHPQVWEMTHAKLGKWLKRAGLACLPAVLLPFKYAFYASLFLMSACILVSYYYYFIYPYRLYRRLKKTDNTEAQSLPP